MPDKSFKYNMMVRWPATCRNRSYEILKERPDLVEQMNLFRQKVDRVCKFSPVLTFGWNLDRTCMIS
jgi:hypothetical protein